MTSLLTLYKITVRDKDGKVIQVHERYGANVASLVLAEADSGNSVTVTVLKP